MVFVRIGETMGKKSLKDKEERRIIGRGEKNLSKREELEKIDNIWEKGEELKKVWPRT